MKDIQLEELLKSKEFMKHAKIANELSKKTGLEHGFTFCKPNDKIIVDKMCVGDKCSIDIEAEKCHKYDNSFHTHPIRTYDQSKFSPSDLYLAAFDAYETKKQKVKCVKAITSNYILCETISQLTKIEMLEIQDKFEQRNEVWRLYPDENFIGFVRNTLSKDRKEFHI